ncbi:MAG: hypothetical protein IJX37_10255 [Oscillospiraceae bacterium]|nr:hypothetical protein [Oscillospiraceae bacterium]
MSETIITKDAASLLRSIHKTYKKRKRSGQPKQIAAILGSSSDIRQEIMSQWSLEDINDACWELHNAGLLECLPGDDSIQMAILTNAGIAYSESRMAGIMKSIWGLLKELLPFIS